MMRWHFGVVFGAIFAGESMYWAWQEVGLAAPLSVCAAIGLYFWMVRRESQP
jgi:hypothetical protein